MRNLLGIFVVSGNTSQSLKKSKDIIDGRGYGPGAKEKILHEAFPKPRLTPWEKATVGALGGNEGFMESPSLASLASPSRSVGSVKSPQEARGPNMIHTLW
jgi:hypothetical protein